MIIIIIMTKILKIDMNILMKNDWIYTTSEFHNSLKWYRKKIRYLKYKKKFEHIIITSKTKCMHLKINKYLQKKKKIMKEENDTDKYYNDTFPGSSYWNNTYYNDRATGQQQFHSSTTTGSIHT